MNRLPMTELLRVKRTVELMGGGVAYCRAGEELLV